MWTIAIQRPNFSRKWSCGTQSYPHLVGQLSGWIRVSGGSKGKEAKFSPPNREQVGVEILDKPKFAHFLVREARLYQEYWTAAWLRAESHWEDRQNERSAMNNTREFAQQEFNSMTRRYNGHLGDKCKCIVTVEKGVVVGSLDLSIQDGETFPGEGMRHPIARLGRPASMIRYAYIANLCVAKSGRRRGVATCMLHYAISTAKATGAQKIFVHVHTNNKPAQDLYHKLGFQVVDAANFQVEQAYLLCLEASVDVCLPSI